MPGSCSRREPQCDADSQLDVAAFRDRGFLILKDAAASDAIARAAAYVATHEACWSAPSGTRPDDWRMHRDQRLDAPVADGHLPILDLLREPRLAAAIRCLAGAEAHAVSYTQVARRTPAPRKARRKNLPDTSYHIDGEANASGARFPDVFSLLVAVALTPHERPGMGNLTVFPRRPPPRLAPVPGLEARQGAPGHRPALRGPAGRRRRGFVPSSLTAPRRPQRQRRAAGPRVLPGATGGHRLRDARTRGGAARGPTGRATVPSSRVIFVSVRERAAFLRLREGNPHELNSSAGLNSSGETRGVERCSC